MLVGPFSRKSLALEQRTSYSRFLLSLSPTLRSKFADMIQLSKSASCSTARVFLTPDRGTMTRGQTVTPLPQAAMRLL